MRHEQPPTSMSMREVKDPVLWREANFDLPAGLDPLVYENARSKPDAHPDDLLPLRGVRLKGAFDGKHYTLFGQLVKYGGLPLRWRTGPRQGTTISDEVVVISTKDKETVWFGTREQYEQTWCVD